MAGWMGAISRKVRVYALKGRWLEKKMSKKKNRWHRWFPWILGVGLLTAALLTFVSCSHMGQANIVETNPGAGKPMPIGVAKVTYEDLSRDLTLAAEFRPYQEIDVHAKVAGYIKEIYVDVGDRVRQGQLL